MLNKFNRLLLSSTASVLSTLCASLSFAQDPAPTELPTGGNVVGGQASISQSNNVMTINQSSSRAVIDWQSFNIGSQATVDFNQPSTNSVALNRVTGASPSKIFGQLNANGKVFITNSKGVYFAPGASVKVGSLGATTHNISVEDFMAGNSTFLRNGSTGSVVNEGQIETSLGGYVALLAPEVRNEGIILAKAGTVALTSGEAITLKFSDGGGLADVTATKSQVDALVENKKAVLAPGGLVILSAQAANTLRGGVVNNEGAIEATGLHNDGGVIRLLASDTITHSGSIDVSAKADSSGSAGEALIIADLSNLDSTTTISGSLKAIAGNQGGDGGFIETSASHVDIENATEVNTLAPNGENGTWLIDPVDFVVSSSGDMTAATLQTNLAGGNVSISSTTGGSGTGGHVYINDAVSWSADTSLTLSAVNDIFITQDVTATGNNAGLNLYYGGTDGTTAPTAGKDFYLDLANGANVTLSGSSPSLKIGNESYTVYNSVSDLLTMGSGSSVRGALGQDLSLSGTNYTTALINSNFQGSFNGLGNALDGYTVRATSGGNIGIFASLQGATVKNLGITNMDIQTNASDTAKTTDKFRIGGLTGLVQGSSVAEETNLYGVWSKGLISANPGSSQAVFFAGGLIGQQNSGRLVAKRTYSTANVSSQQSDSFKLALGGLIGDLGTTTRAAHSATTGATLQTAISESYATGSVLSGTYDTTGSGYYGTGGLVGVVYSSGVTIDDSFSWGNAVSSASFGGLAGFSSGGTFTNYYTTQSGLGNGSPTRTNVYTSATLNTSGGTALPTGFSGTIWDISSSPTLKGLPAPGKRVYIQETTTAGTYGGLSFAYNLVDSAGSAITLGAGDYTGLTGVTGTGKYSISDTTSVGSYNVSYLSGLSFTGGSASNFDLAPYSTATSYTVNKAGLSVTANNLSKTTGGAAYLGGNGVSYAGFVNSETSSVLGGTLAYGGTSQGATAAGTYTIIPSGFTADNYSFTYVNGQLVLKLPEPPTPPTTTTNNNTSTPASTTPRQSSTAAQQSTTAPTSNSLPVGGVNTTSSSSVGTGQLGTSGIQVSMAAPAKTSQSLAVSNSNIVLVSVPKNMTTSGQGFSFELPQQVSQNITTTSVRATLVDGASLPSWLSVNPATKSFEAKAVPDGGLPLEVVINYGNEQVMMVISERNEN
ncbi:putative Filamentous hemagglutinin family N-terminal domain containing protein [Candidatus Terasakiella magnetica]|uniref:Putative Filamentous hemagglutinin family N-terminal domain containing protein n=1 Tax=Candidatus Terasakiella magnetica TaxID=1867952 RepID=A0A1C3RFD1_9PROT|nr:filamentous hemagglutinin N-terminal domain-containing protein [Candidatus Terasakiella magnetica]SCA55990.1 putative Filamentous hemagglutinin family N-terminal domain containing protein [Candidatus Terasakiella magnetica]